MSGKSNRCSAPCANFNHMAAGRIVPNARIVMTVTGATNHNNGTTGQIALVARITAPTGKTGPNVPNHSPDATRRKRNVRKHRQQIPNPTKPTSITKLPGVWTNRNRPNIQKARKRGRWTDRSLQHFFDLRLVTGWRLARIAGAKIHDRAILFRQGFGKIFHDTRIA